MLMHAKTKIRALIIAIFITLAFAALIGRTYWLQVVSAGDLMQKAQSIWEKSRQLVPIRGTIYDRNNKVLAQDAISYIVSVNPRLINEKGLEDEVVEALAPILEMTDGNKRQRLRELVTARREDGAFYVQREIRSEGWKIEKRKADQIMRVIEERNLYGAIHLEETYKRYYPAEDMAAHVLGYINMEGEPVYGLEQYYHSELSGTPGNIQYEQDAKGYELPGAKVIYNPAQDGNDLRLTIDENIQLYIEEAMKAAYEKYSPLSMSAIAVDPNTMEILGMANFPNFNPNSYWDFQSFHDFNNFSVTHAYEPGSTFKVFVLAAAIEEGLFDPEAKFQSGRIKVPGGTISDHNWVGWGEISYLEGLKRSSNVAFVKLGEMLGRDKLIDYYQKFGFGAPTGIDLPGEAKGSIRIYQPMEVATSTFGQGISVTALQQITAVAAIANGGKLMKPYIVKEVIDPETSEVIARNSPQVVRRVLSEAAAKETALYLEQVIADREIGTGSGAYIEGYRIAGKTGTAQKVIDGKYSNEHYILSFVGFAPVDDPRIAVIVTVDDPDIGGNYTLGGSVVIPVFKEIMLQSLRYLGVSRSETMGMNVDDGWFIETPDAEGRSLADAVNRVERAKLQPVVLGNGQEVETQHPKAGTKLAEGSEVYLLTSDPKDAQIPDLTGRSLRDALQVCLLLELDCDVDGEGYVVSQSMTYSGKDRRLRLELAPASFEEPDEALDGEQETDQAEETEG